MVLLSIQRALLGEVSGRLRGVTCEWTKNEILIEAFFDGEIDNSDLESIDCVGSEVAADFPEHQVEVLKTRIDSPIPISGRIHKVWAYMRKED